MIRLPAPVSTEEGSTLPPTNNSSLIPTTLSPTASKSAKLTPLGTLSILPRELRDQIYSIYLHAHGLLYHPNAWLDDQTWCGKSSQGLSIMRVSKAVHAELLSILCSKGLLKIDHFVFSLKKQPSHLPVAKDVCNVSIFLDCAFFSPRSLSSVSGGSVCFFTGTSKMRNSCVLHFRRCTPKARLIRQSPLIHAISQLTAFKTVQLVFTPKDPGWITRSRPQNDDLETLVREISRALEPTLGSFVWYTNRDVYPDDTHCCTFHPREKLDRLGDRSGSQTNEITS